MIINLTEKKKSDSLSFNLMPKFTLFAGILEKKSVSLEKPLGNSFKVYRK